MAYLEVKSGAHDGILATIVAIGSTSARAVPLFVPFSIAIALFGDVFWGAVMVTARYLTNKFVTPLIEKRRAEGRVEGRAEGRVEGRAEGRVEGRAEGRTEMLEAVRQWNERRLAAEAKGEPFDEPLPGADE